jgi:hypothetical protein
MVAGELDTLIANLRDGFQHARKIGPALVAERVEFNTHGNFLVTAEGGTSGETRAKRGSEDGCGASKEFATVHFRSIIRVHSVISFK